ncbi:MAG: DUF3341 domain-containing protein [Chloroflexi bacterium]|nr:DUF3341 domain-containing protein [Chloroflexota bacterium]
MTESTVLMGSFQDLERAADTLDQLRALGISDGDITVVSSMPYSAKALGRPEIKTPLSGISMASALAGLLIGLFFTVVTPYLYVIRVGSQPIVPVPTTALLLYEFIMLILILGSFIGVVVLNNLPTTGPSYDGPALIDDRIGLLFRCSVGEKEKAHAVLESQGAVISPTDIQEPQVEGQEA